MKKSSHIHPGLLFGIILFAATFLVQIIFGTPMSLKLFVSALVAGIVGGGVFSLVTKK